MSDQEKAKPAASSPRKPTKKMPKKVEPAKRGRGRPSEYNSKLHPKLGYNLALRGLTDEQMAVELSISTQTFYTWQNKHKDFLEAIKKAKEDPDSAVEGALFKKATGYEQMVQKPMAIGGIVEIVDYKEKVQPSDTAIIFYLKNRRPDRWRDKQEIETTGVLGTVDLTTLTPEEFEKKKAEFLAKNGGGKKK